MFVSKSNYLLRIMSLYYLVYRAYRNRNRSLIFSDNFMEYVLCSGKLIDFFFSTLPVNIPSFMYTIIFTNECHSSFHIHIEFVPHWTNTWFIFHDFSFKHLHTFSMIRPYSENFELSKRKFVGCFRVFIRMWNYLKWKFSFHFVLLSE